MGIKNPSPRLILALATGLHLSYIPAKLSGMKKWTGAGLIGTAEGLILLPLIPQETFSLIFFLSAACLLSVWLCGRAERILGIADDPRIILDEIIGFWVAQFFLPRSFTVLAACFILFRVFDSLKPPPANWLERLPGGWGVVGDDVGAGLMANVIVRAGLHFIPA